MIKKIIIKVLLVVMVAAFLAVAVVQWLWIKYAIKEKENKFSAQVYDVLNRVVGRVEEVNYIKYLAEMKQQFGEFQNYNDLISSNSGGVTSGWASGYLFDFVTGMNRSGGARSYLPNQGGGSRSRAGKVINQEVIRQTIQSIRFTKRDSTGKTNFYANMNEIMKDFLLRLAKEKDPENVSVERRLESVDLQSLLVSGFRAYNINLPFVYEILTQQDILDKVKMGETENLYYVDLFPQDLVKKGYFLGVRFESVQPLILANMGWMFLSSGFCVFGLMFVFIITIVIIMRQQKLSVIKNDFINNMTHEFKTPIATISLATSAIMKEKVLNDKDQILKFTGMIRSENERMNKYVERILQQAKLDRRELHLNRTDVDINELLREAVGHFMLQVQEAGGKMSCRFEVDSFILYVDEVHILNVFCNLIDNAIKYSLEAPEIEVYTQRTDTGYLVGVQDHGIGISKEAQKKVFKRFFRVNTGNLHNVKGFGLGLSYVKSIVELHNGTIQLTSKKGKGTLVEIRFERGGGRTKD